VEFIPNATEGGSMPSLTPKPALSERTYGTLIWLCAAIIGIVATYILANFYLWFTYSSCTIESRWDRVAPGPVCGFAGLLPHWLIAVALLVANVLAAVKLHRTREYWYREVLDGWIVGFYWHSYAGLFMSGHQEYKVGVRGKTRSGETRVYWHFTNPKVYHEYKKGQRIRFE